MKRNSIVQNTNWEIYRMQNKIVLKRMARLFPKAGIVFEDFWKLIVEEMSFRIPYGSVAEWSKALVLGTSQFDDVGSNPTPASCYFLNSRLEIEDFNILFHQMFPNNGQGKMVKTCSPS